MKCFSPILCCLIILMKSKEIESKENNVSLRIDLVILNQKHPLHEEKASLLQSQVEEQCNNYDHVEIKTHIASKDMKNAQYFTLFPLFEEFCKTEANWLLAVDEYAKINVDNLLELVKDEDEVAWLGYALQDSSPTIIHHYDSPKEHSSYLHPATGFLISANALQKVCTAYNSTKEEKKTKFYIDPFYELSKWIHQNTNVTLKHSSQFCIPYEANDLALKKCAVTAGDQKICQANSTMEDIKLCVAVKTFSGNHQTRLPILRETWMKGTGDRVKIYSDIADEKHGTITTRVNNALEGHCHLTYMILWYTVNDPDCDWLIIVDDDTQINLDRLSSLLACYSPDVPMVMGELYGYNPSGSEVIPFPTGGSGMIFTRPWITLFKYCGLCDCDARDPDDMMIGSFAKLIGNPIIHNSLLHQNHPASYGEKRIKGWEHISFHHISTYFDARRVYYSYLQPPRRQLHQEL